MPLDPNNSSKRLLNTLAVLLFAPQAEQSLPGQARRQLDFGLRAIDALCAKDELSSDGIEQSSEVVNGLPAAQRWLLLQSCRRLSPSLICELLPAAKSYVGQSSNVDQVLARGLRDDPRSDRVHQLFSLSLSAASSNTWLRDWERRDPLAERTVAELEERIRQMEQSMGWRLMAPLRFAGRSSVKARRAVHILRATALHHGGWGGWAAALWRGVKDQGWPGLQMQLGPLGGQRSYRRWVKVFDRRTEAEKQAIRDEIAAMRNPPVIAVVMPTYNSEATWLSAAIDSVSQQLYPHWRLYIADDASTDPAALETLKLAAQSDTRIEVIFREENGHIAAATNSALASVDADWVAFLDHDDLLSEHALYEVAKVIQKKPDVALIYSDEDKINEKGERCDPYFKSDWNYPLFLSHNLITHLAVYRKRIVEEIGGLRAGYDGAQDYDLALRFIEQIQPSQIHHIPRVLYHWRVHSESTAGGVEAKPYAMLAGERAINEHFQRCGIAAHVEPLEFGYRPRFDLPAEAPKASIIIPTRNAHQLVEQCLYSIFAGTDYPDFEVILVDNGSDDPAALAAFERAREKYALLRYVRDEGAFNFARLCNLGVAEARGDFVCLLNNDIEVESADWLEELVAVANQPAVGAVGCKLLYPDGGIQHAGIVLGVGGWAGHAHKGFSADHPGYVGRAALLSSFSAVTGACMMVQKERFLAVGGFDEQAFGVACNDVDLCLRLRERGWKSVYVPWAVLYHHESATRGYEDTPEKKARFQSEVARIWERWGPLMADDPAYNPNLTLMFEDFSLAWPPRGRPS